MNLLQQQFDTRAPVALVTGSGAPRVGRAIANHLASLGCNCVLHANTSVDQANEAANEIAGTHRVETLVVEGPVEASGTATKAVDAIIDRFGRLDILVNSAAIWKPTALEDVTAEEVKRYFDVNAVGTFRFAQVCGLQMTTQAFGGSIVNIGDWGTVRPYLDHAAYFPSKGAVESITRSLAVELSERNRRVRVNCIQPGTVLLADDTPEEQRRRLAECALVGRVGTAAEVAHAVQFLCENGFVTGVCLPVDGGRSVYAPDGVEVGLNTG